LQIQQGKGAQADANEMFHFVSPKLGFGTAGTIIAPLGRGSSVTPAESVTTHPRGLLIFLAMSRNTV
jgi:hypothetical protein